MEHKCKNCLYWEMINTLFTPFPYSGNCVARTKTAKDNGDIEPDKIYPGPHKQGDLMAETCGIGTGAEYGKDCELFSPKL